MIIIKNNKSIKYLLINILSTIIFGLLYYLNDKFINNNLDLSIKLKIVDIKKYNVYKLENSLIYYLWLSLVTQTTVGYSGIIDEKTNKSLRFSEIPYNSHKILNFMQLISIFIYASIFI